MIIIVTQENAVWKNMSQEIRKKTPCAVLYRYDERYFESLLALIQDASYVILYNREALTVQQVQDIQERLAGRPMILVPVFEVDLDVETICREATKLIGGDKRPMNRIWRDKVSAADLKSRTYEIKDLALKTLKLYLNDEEVFFDTVVDLSVQGGVVGYTENGLTYMDQHGSRIKAMPLHVLPLDDLILLIAATEDRERVLESGKQRKLDPNTQRQSPTTPSPVPEAPELDDDMPF